MTPPQPPRPPRRSLTSLLLLPLATAACTQDNPKPQGSNTPPTAQSTYSTFSGIQIPVSTDLTPASGTSAAPWQQAYTNQEGRNCLMIGDVIATTSLEQATQILRDLLATSTSGWRQTGAFRAVDDAVGRLSFTWTDTAGRRTGTAWVVRTDNGFLPVVLLKDDDATRNMVEDSLMKGAA